jgi:altronate dehydratase small subunit
MEAGDDIMKYGEVIGAAVRSIRAGEHVHVHNLEGKRGRGDRIGGE